jgi:pimeloyl-ACP methyl ester carboxylesterase
MTTTDTQTMHRVASRDGTQIAFWSTGTGPPLVVVHGATADHTRWAPVLPYLNPYVTVHAMDRRGRGASGDAPGYDVTREFEDVAAVVDAVARDTGAPVDLLGHSSGGLCALGCAALTPHLRRLVLYEPPADREAAASVPPPVQRRMEDLLARGAPESVLVTFFREVVQMPEHEFSRYRALPAWRARVAAAHTLTRELRAVRERPFDPDSTRAITAPTLMLLGGDSPAFMQADTRTIADALPDARVSVLEGQQHIAIDLVPQVFAERVLAFLHAPG